MNLKATWQSIRAGWPGSARQLDRIEARLVEVQNRENRIMALAQDILDAVTAENTVIDSFITLIEGLIANNTIPAEAGEAILKAIGDEKAKVEAAIVANTPPTP